jgi:hypothetical protein
MGTPKTLDRVSVDRGTRLFDSDGKFGSTVNRPKTDLLGSFKENQYPKKVFSASFTENSSTLQKSE